MVLGRGMESPWFERECGEEGLKEGEESGKKEG